MKCPIHQFVRTHRAMSLVLLALVGFWPALAPAQQKRKDHVLERLDLKQSKVVDAARLIAELSGLNVVTTTEAGKKEITLYLQNFKAIDAIEMMAKTAGLAYREDPRTGTIRIMTPKEYEEDLVVFREDITKVFTLLHPNAASVAMAIRDLYGERVELSLNTISDDDLLTGGGGGFGGGLGGGLGGSFGSGFGGGVGGLGSPFSRSGSFSGSGRFSRGISGNRFSGSGFGGFGRGQRRESREQGIFPSEGLTSGQIAALQQRLQALEGSENRAALSEAIRELTHREPPIYVTINRQHSMVIVRTSDNEAMKAIEQLILQMDRPTPQVLLEMKILRLELDDNFRSVFDLDYIAGPESSGPATSQPRNPLLAGAAVAGQNIVGLGNFPLDPSATLVYQFLNNHLRARIQLFEEKGHLEIVATPTLLASNNRPATIFVGEERVMTTGVNTDVITPATGATTIAISPITEIRDIGLTLRVLPKINADRTVTLTINQESSTLNPGSATIPVGGSIGTFTIDTVNTATVSGTIVSKDGLTVAIGGLIEVTKRNTVLKVPVLGDLPGIGFLFRRQVLVDKKTELVLLVTPHVITTPTEGEIKTRWRMQELSSHPYFHQHPGHAGHTADLPHDGNSLNLESQVQELPPPQPE